MSFIFPTVYCTKYSMWILYKAAFKFLEAIESDCNQEGARGFRNVSQDVANGQRAQPEPLFPQKWRMPLKQRPDGNYLAISCDEQYSVQVKAEGDSFHQVKAKTGFNN
ncbi:hypothetical protein [Bacillus velezensis]|uniref:hypothetical protein n=1 Tax=Bacillus velezensis TaxID=492670 RepID=UPI002FFF56F2